MRTVTIAIYFASASFLLYFARAAPDHGMKAREQHKAADITLDSDMAEYFEAPNPAMREKETEVELEYDLSERKKAERVADISGALPPDEPGLWKKVGYLDMTDPTQKCPPSWSKISSPRASCGMKSTTGGCDSLAIGTSGASYQTVCGRFRGYQIGALDAFTMHPDDIEQAYVDGISITYGAARQRKHIFTYAAGRFEAETSIWNCPCFGGDSPPSFVGTDFYCESGNPGSTWADSMYFADVLWDGQQCNGLEATCCNAPNLPWFCKTLPAPITGDLEVRMCMDGGVNIVNLAMEFFELYIK